MSVFNTIGGYLIDAGGAQHRLPLINNPSDLEIEDLVKKVSRVGRGVVTFTFAASQEIGPDKLELYVDAGYFLLMLGVVEADGDYSVRTITNDSMPNDLVIIMGEKYPARALTRDIDIVCAAFSEFSRVGDVRGMR